MGEDQRQRVHAWTRSARNTAVSPKVGGDDLETEWHTAFIAPRAKLDAPARGH
jgi:hypothetical protein